MSRVHVACGLHVPEGSHGTCGCSRALPGRRAALVLAEAVTSGFGSLPVGTVVSAASLAALL